MCGVRPTPDTPYLINGFTVCVECWPEAHAHLMSLPHDTMLRTLEQRARGWQDLRTLDAITDEMRSMSSPPGVVSHDLFDNVPSPPVKLENPDRDLYDLKLPTLRDQDFIKDAFNEFHLQNKDIVKDEDKAPRPAVTPC